MPGFGRAPYLPIMRFNNGQDEKDPVGRLSHRVMCRSLERGGTGAKDMNRR